MWEYKKYSSKTRTASITMETLKEFGDDGWEMSGALPVHGYATYYFKRLKSVPVLEGDKETK